MKISTLIKKLEAAKATLGDIQVEARNVHGDASTAIKTRTYLTFVPGKQKKDFPRSLLIES